MRIWLCSPLTSFAKNEKKNLGGEILEDFCVFMLNIIAKKWEILKTDFSPLCKTNVKMRKNRVEKKNALSKKGSNLMKTKTP